MFKLHYFQSYFTHFWMIKLWKIEIELSLWQQSKDCAAKTAHWFFSIRRWDSFWGSWRWMNPGYMYMIYFFQEILFLNLCISHGIVRSEILSQPLFYYKVSTVRPPWAACDDLYLWQWLCLLSLYIVCILYPQFYISHSGQIPCYHVLSL